MLNAFGVCAGGVGLVLVIWFFHIGFIAKKILKEQQETNRLLRQAGDATGALKTAGKAA
ncbi:MAG: hypothetical protein ACLQVL_10805 [Terriglobia bacterium]